MPKRRFLPHPCACGGRSHPLETFLEYQLSDSNAFSGDRPQAYSQTPAGRSGSIKNKLRRSPSSLPSHEMPKRDLCDGRAFTGHIL